MEMFERDFGPMVMARQVLGDDAGPSCTRPTSQMVERENAATDGSLRLEADYLLTVARKPA